MKSNYKQLGQYIRQVDVRNVDGKEENLLGVSVQKQFIPSIANTVGTDFSKYKFVKKRQFTYIPDTSRRGDKIGIALLEDYEEGLVSNVYTVFEVIDENQLMPEYLMLWFKRPEFDRYARFKSHGSVREVMDWDEMCKVELPVPPIEKQRNIVKAYQTITDRIALKRKINENLEATAQAILLKAMSSNQVSKMKLDDLVEFIDGDRGKNYPTFNEFEPEGFCLFLNATNVTPLGFNFETCMFVTEEKDKVMKKGHLSPFDIVLTSRGTLGNVALYDNNVPYKNVRINSGMLIIRPKTARFSPYFIYALLKSKYMKAAIEQFRSGSAQPQLPIKDLQKISFDIPDGTTILKITNMQLQAIEEMVSKGRYEIDKLKVLSRILLAKLSC